MERAGDILKGAFKGSLSGKGRRYAAFFSNWEGILGREAAKNIKLVDIKKETLLLTATHPAWLQMITIKKDRLISVIKRTYPELGIKNIKITLRSEKSEQKQKQTKPVGDETDRENEELSNIDLKEQLKTIKNTELKAVLQQLYKSIRKRP